MWIFSKRQISIFQKVLISFSLLVSIFVTVSCNLKNSYFELIWTWPAMFTIFLLINFSSLGSIKPTHFISLSLIIVTQMVPRYLIYPLLLQFTTDGYMGSMHFSMSGHELQSGIIIGAVELFCFIFFLYLYERSRKKEEFEKRQLTLIGNKMIYFAFLLVALVLFLLIGKDLNIIQFVTVSEDTNYNTVRDSMYYILLRYVLTIAMALITIIYISYFRTKYNITGNARYFWGSLMIAMLLCLMITGTSRGSQITLGLLLLLILIEEYPSKKKTIFICLFIAVVIAVVSITQFRAVGDRSFFGQSINDLADKFQVYFGGPGSIYQSIIVFENRELTFGNFVFDFVRSIFPLNIFFKNYGSTVNQLYNQYLYSGYFSHGHIVFSASYGYIFFDILGIPLIMCLNYYLATKANEVFCKTNSYEFKFVTGFCMLRLVNAFLINTPNILGSVTQYIGTFGLLIFISKVFRQKKQIKTFLG